MLKAPMNMELNIVNLLIMAVRFPQNSLLILITDINDHILSMGK